MARLRTDTGSSMMVVVATSSILQKLGSPSQTQNPMTERDAYVLKMGGAPQECVHGKVHGQVNGNWL